MRPKKLAAKPMTRQSIRQGETISDFLTGNQSGRFGTIIDTSGGEKFPVSFSRDSSAIGVYNVVLKSPDGKRSQRIRMMLRGGTPMREAEKFFLEYMNVDSPGRFAFEGLEGKKVAAPKMPKSQVSGHPADIPLKQRLAEYEKIRFKTQPQEREIAHLQELIKADPNKFKVGEGVAWKIFNQTNRGFRVLQVFPERKEAVIGLVKDTGFADINVGHRELVHIGDLMRDRKYDA